MKKISAFIVKIRYFLLAFWVVATAVSIFLIPRVKIEYDTTVYLPENTRVKQSLRVMEEEFGLTGQASVMIEDVDPVKVFVYKDKINSMPYIMEVIWIDNFIERDVIQNIQDLFDEYDPNGNFRFGAIPGLNAFYKDRTALLQVVFTENDHSLNVGNSIELIREYLGTINKPFALSGTAINAYQMRETTKSEVFKTALYVAPIILIILIIFTKSWLEPLVFLASVLVSVIVNMGTNIMFPSVSFLTNATASLLQLAISMDYSIFLLHAYQKEKEAGLEQKEAMATAMKKSFSSINSSMITTVAGFAAIMFMRYTIGMDLSRVMIKGILLSLIVTFTFMPSLIIATDNLLKKTQHKPFFPKIGKLTKFITKTRYVIPALLLMTVVPSYIAQTKNHFVYGDGAMAVRHDSGEMSEADRIEQKFGRNNMIVVLVPIDEDGNYKAQEKAMIRQLNSELDKANEDYRPTIQSYSTLTDIETYISNYNDLPPAVKSFLEEYFDPTMIEDMISENFKKQFISENYSRVIISINTETESPRAEKAVNIIETVVARQPFADEAHIIGVSPSVKEIKEVVEKDYVFVNLLSIVLVFVVLLVNFKSAILPFILLFVIELGIFINMAIPYITGMPLIFIGFMIVSSVQLGATIDYAILFTQFYVDARKTLVKRDAIKYALDHGGHSILTSSLILTTAGYVLKFASSVTGVSAIGELIGRGAALSGVLVIFLLPMLLYIFDKAIAKTTMQSKFYFPPDVRKKENYPSDYDPTLLT
ncbi:MAG: MMPL family transporter [Bacilli bacterium]|jgi:predicted RND superfamily exporter protein|nr:MMPL family transporter [Bacilli bacterium]